MTPATIYCEGDEVLWHDYATWTYRPAKVLSTSMTGYALLEVYGFGRQWAREKDLYRA